MNDPLLLSPSRPSARAVPASARETTRYVLCGLSARGIYHFILPLTGKGSDPFSNDFSAHSCVSAVLDVDEKRVAEFNRKTGLSLSYYPPSAFDRMIREQRPDIVLVTGPDFTHFEHIIRAMENGCDVIVEKPMVITTEQAWKILQKEKETGRRVQVTFNVRYKPIQQTLKRMLMKGTIGKIVNIEFNYNLDTEHGSSYFFRWNRVRAKSGGLNIHKVCHQLDLVNWWLNDWPETVFAFGSLNYYGSRGAHRPLGLDGEPLSPEETKRRCPYYQKHLARANAPEAARIKASWDRFDLPYAVQYPPDRPAYIYDDEIDVEDTYGVLIRYRQGAILNYSVNFSAPWEGYNVGINGTHGRIEIADRVSMSPNPNAPPCKTNAITVLPLFGEKYTVDIQTATGGHGGADEPLQRDLFDAASPESRELHLMADSIAGAYAVAAGEAVWLSSSTGTAIPIPRFEEMPAAGDWLQCPSSNA